MTVSHIRNTTRAHLMATALGMPSLCYVDAAAFLQKSSTSCGTVFTDVKTSFLEVVPRAPEPTSTASSPFQTMFDCDYLVDRFYKLLEGLGIRCCAPAVSANDELLVNTPPAVSANDELLVNTPPLHYDTNSFKHGDGVGGGAAAGFQASEGPLAPAATNNSTIDLTNVMANYTYGFCAATEAGFKLVKPFRLFGGIMGVTLDALLNRPADQHQFTSGYVDANYFRCVFSQQAIKRDHTDTSFTNWYSLVVEPITIIEEAGGIPSPATDTLKSALTDISKQYTSCKKWTILEVLKRESSSSEVASGLKKISDLELDISQNQGAWEFEISPDHGFIIESNGKGQIVLIQQWVHTFGYGWWLSRDEKEDGRIGYQFSDNVSRKLGEELEVVRSIRKARDTYGRGKMFDVARLIECLKELNTFFSNGCDVLLEFDNEAISQLLPKCQAFFGKVPVDDESLDLTLSALQEDKYDVLKVQHLCSNDSKGV